MPILPTPRFLRGVMRPEAFHGVGDAGPFFEGWYVKLIARSGRPVVLIPGVFEGGSDPHAFVMVADGGRDDSHILRFPTSAFGAADDAFVIGVGPNRFHVGGVEVDLDHPEWPVRGSVRFGSLEPWPVTVRAPGAMGWYGWMPFLECYHGVVSMAHEVSGSLEVGGERVDFDGGRGYIETDWGRNFPDTWVWVHAFVGEASVMVSIARVPFLGGSFPGFLAAVLLGSGELVRFATWTGAEITSLATEDDAARVVLEDDEWRLEVEATIGHPVELAGPSSRGMDRTVVEGIESPVAVRLSRGGEIVLEGSTDDGGVEVHGSAEQRDWLTHPGWRRS